MTSFCDGVYMRAHMVEKNRASPKAGPDADVVELVDTAVCKTVALNKHVGSNPTIRTTLYAQRSTLASINISDSTGWKYR